MHYRAANTGGASCQMLSAAEDALVVFVALVSLLLDNSVAAVGSVMESKLGNCQVDSLRQRFHSDLWVKSVAGL